jgi:hypothetical protein
MTDKTIESDVAFGEAAQNLRAAERFFNAGATEKAYAAAYIANAWTGLGSALQAKELGAVPQPYLLEPLTISAMPPSAIADTTPAPIAHQHTEDLCGHPHNPFRDDCPMCNMPIEQFTQNPVCSARCELASE